ncbi:MAG TPA: hypothetical protein VFF47_08895 [Nitrospirota bacterium]|nr:hypothetical protein [Nitrospirota bacterium]
MASMKMISDAEVEKRIRAWADVTMLSIELKLAMFRGKYPNLTENELRELIRKEYSTIKDNT